MIDAGMGERPRAEFTTLLREVEAGSDGAREALFELVYSELHRRAHVVMGGQPAEHTLQATALVGEVYLRLFRGDPGPWRDRRHFLLTASRAMRHVLIDHARRKASTKRDGDRVDTPLDALLIQYEERALDLEALQQALGRLEELDPDMAKAVELRFFCDATVEETSRVLGMSRRTFERRWQMTRAWLFGEIR